jgi:broad specificity phosphatase PhoE
MTEIVLVRHGQTEWNKVERIRGRADIALDATGLAQAEVTGQRVASEFHPVEVYCSPLQRALQTARAIASLLGREPQIDAGFVDMDFGAWQGLSAPEVRQRWPGEAVAWVKAPHTVSFPGGESLSAVRERSAAALHALIERHQNQTIAVVAHTVVNRVLLCHVLGIETANYWRIGQETCALNVFTWRDEVFYIQSLNDTGHLRPLRED